MLNNLKADQDIKIEQILESIDFIQYIENEYSIPVSQQSNGEYRINCPFIWHRDSTPSFDINNDKKLFICRGCNHGGTIINFVMYLENITFKQAVLKLLHHIGYNADISEYEIQKVINRVKKITSAYLTRDDVENYPLGMSEYGFCGAFTKSIKDVDFNFKEKLYKTLDKCIERKDYKNIEKLWVNLNSIVKSNNKEILNEIIG